MNSLKILFKLLYQILLFFFYGVQLIFRKSLSLTSPWTKDFSNLGNPFETARQRFKKLFRFSITFKITVVYGFITSLLLLLSSISILLVFRFFLMDQVATDMATTSIQILAGVLFAVNGISIIIILMIGSRVSRKMLQPIDHMTQTVKAITIQDMNKRLDVKGSQDELKELAETFNAMFDRIQASYEQQNRFVSDASHELRTPISVIQGYANLLDRWGKEDKPVLEESILAIKGEAENMKELMEKLLFLARSDKGLQKLEMNTFSLQELIQEVVKETRLIDSHHHIVDEATENLLIYADRNSLKQALRIFMDNSIKFTPSEGTIGLKAYRHKNQMVIVIEDTGAGIPKEDIPHIFNRFYRSDKSRTKASGGHGLGLSIAKWIIDKHGGRVEVESVVQVGTKIKIFLPSPK